MIDREDVMRSNQHLAPNKINIVSHDVDSLCTISSRDDSMSDRITSSKKYASWFKAHNAVISCFSIVSWSLYHLVHFYMA